MSEPTVLETRADLSDQTMEALNNQDYEQMETLSRIWFDMGDEEEGMRLAQAARNCRMMDLEHDTMYEREDVE